MPASPTTRRPMLDERALAHVLRRLDAAAVTPWLHAEAARRMGERLALVKLQPRTVLDWWPALGGGAEVLRAAYPRAHRSGVGGAVPAAPPWWLPRRLSRTDHVAEDAVADGSAQLVWANMVLHGTADPQALLARWQRSLTADGFVMFTTLGPGTFEALTRLYRDRGWGVPFAPFVDMHDLGDMLVASGFADPVMDQETLTLTWRDAPALLAELRSIGGNVDRARVPGLRTPRWRAGLEQALAGALAGSDGRPALQVELVYGHAFKAAPRLAVAAETAVPVETLRSMARSGRGQGPAR